MMIIVVAISVSSCATTVRDLEADIPIPLEMKQATPQEAVETYLEWLTYSYRNMDSEIATPTMTPDLARRVSYYITMNAADGNALNQRLDSFSIKDTEINDTIATVTTEETWTFNYLSLETGNFTTPVVESYRVSYIVLLIDGRWIVQSADAEIVTLSD